MNELILNMTRFGDLLQTQPLVGGLKARGARTGLVHMAGLDQAVSLLSGLDDRFALEGEELARLVAGDWRKALGSQLAWSVEIMGGFRPTGMTNLTPSLSMRMLARSLALLGEERHGLAERPEERGFWIDADGFGVNVDSWSLFLQASSASRGCSPFNLVDLFCRAGGLGRGRREFTLVRPSGEALASARRMLVSESARQLGEEERRGLRGFVGFQMGASQDRRRWPVAFFADLGARLLKDHKLCPVLVGGRNEKELARKYRRAGGAGVDLMGRTSLAELAAAVAQFSVLASNDTGTMHLAAGLGVPVAAVFLATAQPWDTGPYQDGAMCLEPDMECHPCAFGSECPHGLECRRAITPEAMACAIGGLLEPGLDFPAGAMQGARVWKSAREADGLMGLESLSGHEHEDRTGWIRLQRALYGGFLDGRAVTGAFGHTLSPETRQEALAVLDASAQLLTLLEQQAAVLAVHPMESMKNKFLSTWQRVRDQWESSRLFQVLGLMWTCQSQDASADMARISSVVGGYRRLMDQWRGLLS